MEVDLRCTNPAAEHNPENLHVGGGGDGRRGERGGTGGGKEGGGGRERERERRERERKDSEYTQVSNTNKDHAF